jgi:diguanylate cyclase (GGDEF)-like protein/PAS domain S-box-containing protein
VTGVSLVTYRLNDCCADFLQMAAHLFCICEDGIVVWINDAGLRLLDAPSEAAVVGRPIAAFVAEHFADLFGEELGVLADESEAIPLSILTVTAKPIDGRVYVSRIQSEDTNECYLIECQDISDLIKASKATRGREERIHAILGAVDQAIITIDEFGIMVDTNKVSESLFGHKIKDMIGQNVKMLMPEPHSSQHGEYLTRYQTTGRGHLIDQTREMEGLKADGSVFPIELTVTEVSTADNKAHYIGSVRDISVRRAQEEQIRFLAFNDALTGLPNRASFNGKVEEALQRARRSKSGFALMFIDLDEFKPINDTFGHEAGDIVLKTVAERLKELIRTTDTAARLGGDEFVLILENVPNREELVVVAKTLLENVPKPIPINSATCSVGLSIGISHYPTDAESVVDLLSAADAAMYKVKESGRNNYSFC